MREAAEARWPGRVAAALLALWYVTSMARGLAWFDSGELALVGSQLGLGHPPGQPLYTLLLGLFARLPGIEPLAGMNLFSALTAAACALPTDRLVARLTPATPRVRCLALLCVGGLAPMWDQGTRIELYGLATLLSLTLLAAGLAVAQAGRRDARAWLGLGVLSGLLACVNPVFALASALAVGLYALPMLGRAAPLAVLAAVAGAVVGLLPYAHLWWVHDATDRLVWGELDHWPGVRAYLTGADYRGTEHGAWGEVPAHVAQWLVWLTTQGGAPVVALGALGWLGVTLRRHLALAILPAATGAAFTFTYGAAFFPEVPDYNGYLAPAMWLGACGLAVVVERLPRAPIWAAGLLLATLATGERPLWDRTRADLVAPRGLAEAWLGAAPADAVLLVRSDHLVFPLMYLQEAEGRRRDVVVLNTGFAASSWYWRRLYRAHPDLPVIELRAPDTRTRLRRLVAGTTRPVVAEDGALLAGLGLRPCSRTWGAATGPACAEAVDDPAAFADALRSWRHGDAVTTNVLAAISFSRAETLWALGDASGALVALRAGVPNGQTLPTPTGLARPVNAPPLQYPTPVLIGSALHNRLVGAQLLELLDRPAEATRWAGDQASVAY